MATTAARKLADLQASSALTDPAAIERKRAVVEAALARARAARHGG
jgi:Na+-translocating ferredoxin:NAD+ oxidoreductase subunit B